LELSRLCADGCNAHCSSFGIGRIRAACTSNFFELWQALAHNTTVMSALVYRRLELDAGNTRNDVIHRAHLMQSNAETISSLERKYREYTAELRRRYL
jgi:hypothetical protein